MVELPLKHSGRVHAQLATRAARGQRSCRDALGMVHAVLVHVKGAVLSDGRTACGAGKAGAVVGLASRKHRHVLDGFEADTAVARGLLRLRRQALLGVRGREKEEEEEEEDKAGVSGSATRARQR